jgi:hypothetical protein
MASNMKKITFFLLIFTLLLACKNEPSLTDFQPPKVETMAVYSTEDNEAEVNLLLTNVKGTVKELGVVWSEKPNPTVADNKEFVGGFKVDQTVLLKLANLQKSKTYYVRSYIVNDQKVSYGSELVLVQNFTNEWQKLPSLAIYENEYITSDGAFYNGFSLGFSVVNKLNNYATKRYYYPSFRSWNLDFEGPRNRPEQMRFNEIRANFFPGTPAILIGAGHYKNIVGKKLFLTDLKIIGIDGYKWEPIYPGIDAETCSFGIGNFAYALENVPEGRLWQFEFSNVVRWNEIIKIPYKKNAKYLGTSTDTHGYVMIEPEQWDDSQPDLLEFNPVEKTWKKMTSFPATNRRRGTIFGFNNRVFYGLGQDAKTLKGLRDIWEFIPATNSWRKTIDYPGSGTINVATVSFDKEIYLGFGQQVIINDFRAEKLADMADFWLFRPK